MVYFLEGILGKSTFRAGLTVCYMNFRQLPLQTKYSSKFCYVRVICPRSYDCNSHVVCTNHVTVNLRQNYYESDYDKVRCKCARPIIIIMFVYRNHFCLCHRLSF